MKQRGQLLTIIGRQTFPAEMNFVTNLARHTNPRFVGEPTGGMDEWEDVPPHLPAERVKRKNSV